MSQARPLTRQARQPSAAPVPISRGEQAPQRGLARRGEWAPSIWGASPFGLVRRFSEEMDRFFSDVFSDFGIEPSAVVSRMGRGAGLARGDFSPPMEVFRRDNQLVVQVDLPGMDADEISVEVTEDMLTISGEREEEREENREDYSMRERRYGRFVRTVPLPEGVNPDEMHATMRHGVLEITMPLPQRERGRRIKIQSGAEVGAEAPRGQAATGG